MSGEMGRIDVRAFIAALDEAGCQPQEVSPGYWLAWCPACKAQGRASLMEIHVLSDRRVDLAAVADGCH